MSTKLTEAAKKVTMEQVDATLRQLAVTHGALAHRLLQIAYVHVTTDVPTAAVGIRGDGVVRLFVNPEFFDKLDNSGRAFVLMHEAYHLLWSHLYVDSALKDDQMFTTAEEATINHMVLRHVHQLHGRANDQTLWSQRKRYTVPGGGVDPRSIYSSYAYAAKQANDTVVSYAEFIASDIGAYALLKRVNPKLRNVATCLHQQGNGDGDGGDGSAGAKATVTDPSTLKRVVGQALEDAVARAATGDTKMKEVIMELADATPEASQTWGDVGVGALRGETDHGRAHSMWAQLTTRAIKSLIDENGERYAYNRKIGWWYEPLTPTGRDEQSNIVVAIDTSGSVPQAIVDRLATMVGDIPHAKTTWLAFDAAVWPFAPGEEMKGGGGTSFQVVADYLYKSGEIDGEIDAVLMVTDGHAPHIMPPQADRWLWLIVNGGDTWPDAEGMACIRVDEVLASV